MTEKTEKVTNEKTENKPYETDGTENINASNEKLFTQKELEEILSERLKRERKTNQALTSVKKLLKTAGQKGLVKGNSYCEMAEDFCKKLGSNKEVLPENTLSAEQGFQNKEFCEDALTGEFSVTENDTLLGKEEDSRQNEIPEENQDEVHKFASTLGILKDNFAGENIGYLLSSGLFESFAKGRRGNLIDVFSDFCEFMSHIPQNRTVSDAYYGKEEDIFDEFDDGFSSTAFSSHPSNSTSYEDGLTKQQMDIAKSAGMSYREYAQLLGTIPKNKTRKSY